MLRRATDWSTDSRRGFVGSSQPAHEDHHRDVLSLRLALGSILSPKRPHPAQSSATSGTASPALHCPHSAIPLGPSVSSSSAHGSIHSANSGSPAPHTPHTPQPALPSVESATAVHALDDTHPRVPDAVSTHGHGHAHSLPASGGVSGSATPGGRANFIGTLQSKSAWDALIHGSWV
ncbi:hypothetical protein C8Q70DRAFT_936078 [Cubamyces menziesii]|nr:hypothetical protein C8Q70DRAFT_936078 [Cubamyces menziesii]